MNQYQCTVLTSCQYDPRTLLHVHYHDALDDDDVHGDAVPPVHGLA